MAQQAVAPTVAAVAAKDDRFGEREQDVEV
jgi:hypothetical protein